MSQIESTYTAQSLAALGLEKDSVSEMIDRMGDESYKAQGLDAVLTTSEKLLVSDHKLYMIRDAEGPTGILKVAGKHLYYVDHNGAYSELDCLCVMDFYVSARCQRCGVGIRLFKLMLAAEGAQPAQLAYDRPSPKMLSFLQRHFNLVDFVEQPNRFVIFNDFFE